MTAKELIKIISQRLSEHFQPTSLVVEDDTHQHVSHASYQPGKYHFTIRISSDAFMGHGLVAQHRMIYHVLDDLMQQYIHALKINIIADSNT